MSGFLHDPGDTAGYSLDDREHDRREEEWAYHLEALERNRLDRLWEARPVPPAPGVKSEAA